MNSEPDRMSTLNREPYRIGDRAAAWKGIVWAEGVVRAEGIRAGQFWFKV